MKYVFVLFAALMMAGCHTPVPKTHPYSDTSQGRTARYVHEHCWKVQYFPGRNHWNSAVGELETVPGDTLYECPGEDNWIAIEDDEERP